MKKILTFIFSTALLFTGCGYDDDDLWKKVDELDDRLTALEKAISQMNGDITTLQSLINTINNGGYISTFSPMNNGKGWILTLSNGETIEIFHGDPGAEAPIITVLEEGGVYYWAITVNGQTDFLYADQAKTIKLPVTGEKGEAGQNGQNGQDAVTPEIGVDEEGYWTIDYGKGGGPQRIEDANGNHVPAAADSNPYLFVEILDNGRYYTFVLADGTSIDVQKRVGAEIVIDTDTEEYFRYGQERMFAMRLRDVVNASSSGPRGWEIYIDIDNSELWIKAPADGVGQSSGTIRVSAAGIDGALVTTDFAVRAGSYEIRYLTFEDADYRGGGTNNYWSSLIDSKQYGGVLLYGESGYGPTDYSWHDQGNTELYSHILGGSYAAYWSGGHAVSNYTDQDVENHADYLHQLSVYYRDPVSGHGGRKGSENFCMHFGYNDWFNPNADLPFIRFQDNVARVVDHMWITSSTYFLGVAASGNDLSPALKDGDWIRVAAVGYLDGVEVSRAEFELANYEMVVTDWVKWDLHSLGAVTEIKFNMKGSTENGSGFSIPAYFAYDDVAVRFE